MKHLQRRDRVSALFIISTLIGCSLSLTGCVTPVHQQKAAELFSKTYVGFADFSENEMPEVLERLVILEATSIALKPDRSLDDRIVAGQRKVILASVEKAKSIRIFAEIPKILLEDDRSKLWKALNELRESRKAMAEEAERLGIHMHLELPDETSVRSKPKEEVIKHFAQRIAKFGRDLSSPLDGEIIKACQVLTVEVRSKAARILEDAEQPLAARLAALDRYKAASALPYALESWKQRVDTVFRGVTTVSDEIAKALQDPSYKKEDLQAFIAEVDKVLTEIGNAIPIGKRLLSILLLL